MKTSLTATPIAVAILCSCCGPEAQSAVTLHYRGLYGYISYNATTPPAGFGAGMSFYSAVWPLSDENLANFQIGLAGSWITPDNSDDTDTPLAPVGTYARDNWPERGPTWSSVFQTIEGGLGYWGGNRFRYGPPKFSMNSTPQCYDYELASPGWSFFGGSQALPDNRLGIAQLSNRLLVPPDALPFAGSPNGQFLGYAYMGLPFTDATTGDPPTGDQAWTCFLSAANFKGPVAFFIPETWSKIGKLFNYPYDYGRGLDARAGVAGGGAMEINTVPCLESVDSQGVRYAKIPKLQFPVDELSRTLLVRDLTYYSKAALYDAFKAWRNGGAVCSGGFGTGGAWKSTLTAQTPSYGQAEENVVGVSSVFNTKVYSGNVWGLTWFTNAISPRGFFPQYFKEVSGQRVAVSAAAVPAETGLLTRQFDVASRGTPYTSPGAGAWSQPGAARGPFTVTLLDGSKVTYSWYRFIDQPSFQQYGWSAAKKEQLQAFIEQIHANWPINRDYMAPPTGGELATLDPALFVEPPPGLEVGYVPIVTRQEDSGLVVTDATLANLVLSAGTLTPAFGRYTCSYTASVPYATTNLTVTPTAAGAGATIKVNGATVVSGSTSGPISLSVGVNVITTVVVAQNLSATNTYTLTVSRAVPSTNAWLANLVPGAGVLTPAFGSNTFSYTASVPYSTMTMTVTPTAADAGATITVNGNPVASGSPSSPISLALGANVITTVVVAQSLSVTNVYMLAVTVGLLGGVGDNSFGQLTPPAAAASPVAIAAGAWHSLALRSDGQVAAWGNDYDGQCDVPAGLKDVVAIAAGGYHSLALRWNGEVTAWGANDDGQADVPSGLADAIAVAAGTWHSLALRANGTVVGWGDNTFGQATAPVGLSNVVAIAAGGSHSLALLRDGTVVAWGENTDAAGNYAGQSVVPLGLTNVVAVAAGEYHSLAVRGDGALALWGDNSEGQCTAPDGVSGVVALAGGGSHTLALKADTTVAAWGNNWSGQCSLPLGLTNVVAMAAGNSHTLLLRGIPPFAPVPLHPARRGEQFTVLTQTAAGKRYALDYKSSLQSTNWSSLPPVYGVGGLQVLVDPDPADLQRFYRIRQW